jgi:hypothetical protein
MIMCRTVRIDPADAARALRAIPSERRAEASRANGRHNRKGHGGRPRHDPCTYKLHASGAGFPEGGEFGGYLGTLDDCEAAARTSLKPGQVLSAFRGESSTPTARWAADETGRVARVRTF